MQMKQPPETNAKTDQSQEGKASAFERWKTRAAAR
jgi:hypothetical protein